MILSFERGYICYGMAKTGSTTLHYLLGNRSDSDIVLTHLDHGKHVDCKVVYRDLHALFAKYPYEQFIKFGVIREPLKLLLSWYRIWSDEKLADPNNPNHHLWLEGRTLEEFVTERESVAYQGGRRYQTAQDYYTLADGSLGIDYLVRNEHMSEDLARFEAVLPLGLVEGMQQTRLNVYRKPSAKDIDAELTDSLKQRIRQLFAADYELYERVTEINEAFISGGRQPQSFSGGKALFKRHYPQLYRHSRNDKIRLLLKRVLRRTG